MSYFFKIIFLVLICLCCYLAFQQFQKLKKINTKTPSVTNNSKIVENFSTGKGTCPDLPKLYDVNYLKEKGDYDTEITKKQYIKYYLEGADKDDTNLDKFYYIIHSKQPFHNDITNELDTDEIGDIRQNPRYIFVMNKARTMLMRSDRNKLDGGQYTNMLQSMDAYDNSFKFDNRMITSWGVSTDSVTSEQYVCLFVRNFKTKANSYLIMFKTKMDGVPVFKDILNVDLLNKNNSSDLFYIKIDLDLQGDIYLKKNIQLNKDTANKDKNIYSLYVTNYVSGKTELTRIDIDTESMEKINSVVLYSVGSVTAIPSDFFTGKLELIYTNLENYKSQIEVKNDEYLKLKSIFDELKAYYDVIDSANKFNNIQDYFEEPSKLFPNRFKMYRFFSEVLHDFSKARTAYGIYNIRVDEKDNKIYICENENGNSTIQLKISEKEIKVLNTAAAGSARFNPVTISGVGEITSNLAKNLNTIITGITGDDAKKNELILAMKKKELMCNNLMINENRLVNKNTNDVTDYNPTRTYFLQTYKSPPLDLDASTQKQNLSKFYLLNEGKSINGLFTLQDKSLNVIGVLDFDQATYDSESSPKIKNFVKQPRRVIYTIYQKIINNGDKDTESFGRYNNRDISIISSESIPAQKFNYTIQSLNDEFETFWKPKFENSGSSVSIGSITRSSLFQAFKNNTLEVGKPPNPKKFIDFVDWIHLFNLLRGEGLYDIKKQDPEPYRRIYNAIENNEYFNQNSDKWTTKHQTFVRQENDKIYEESVLKYFPNILVFDLLGEKLETNLIDLKTEMGVYLHLKYSKNTLQPEYTEDIINPDRVLDDEFHFLELIYDKSRGLPDEAGVFTNTIDGKKYDYYKLVSKPKNKVLSMPLADRESFIWQKKPIHTFNEFLKFILEDVINEEDPRDRLRGIYELPSIFIDDDYISYLEDNSTAIGKEKLSKIIEEKKKERDKNMISMVDTEGTLKRRNMLGYPFIVYYKYIDYNGLPCEPTTKNKQKIILSNRVVVPDIFNSLSEASTPKNTKTNIFTKPKYRYPLLKQEFFSFAGHGNIIQYYDKKFGGITSIQPKKTCADTESTFLDSCSKNPNKDCQQTILSYTSISGEPKCEIDDDGIIKYNVSPVEVLLPQAVPKNACQIFIMKGTKKIYFTLGKIFSQGTVKYQLKNIYTIKNENDKYFYVEGSNVKEGDESIMVDDLGQVKPEFVFLARTESDKYGRYYLFESDIQRDLFLTADYHPFQHTLGGGNSMDAISKISFTLKPKKNLPVNNRNFINDEDYYAQKFNMRSALLYNTMAEEKQQNEEFERLKRQKMIDDALAAQYFPEYAIGDKDFKPIISTEEEKQALERLLNNIAVYQKNMLRIDPVELPNLESVQVQLDDAQKITKKRVPLIRKKIEGLRYNAKISEIIDTPSIYSNLGKIPKKPESPRDRKNISDNNNNSKRIMQANKINQMGLALEAIKDFIPKTERKQPQCKSIFEGFENIYSDANMSNHMVDKYNQFVSDRVDRTNQNLGDKKDELYKTLKSIGSKMESLRMDGKKQQVILNQHIEDGMDIAGDVYYIRDQEQKMKMDRMDKKLKEIKKLRCKLGDLKVKSKIKDHPNYNSIISQEDGSLLNVYQISKCDKLSPEDVKLNKNMIFVNGGCLEYNEDSGDLDVKHCLVNNEKQLFELHMLQKEEDYQKFKIQNDLKPGEILESPHYIISKPKIDMNSPAASGEDIAGSPSIYSDNKCDFNYAKFNNYVSDVEEKNCREHKSNSRCLYSENGKLSMRDCEDVKPQKWDYSDITGPCK